MEPPPNAQAVLHITNGDATVTLLQRAGVDGTLLPWRDCLHEGPVPGGRAPEALAAVRAAHLAAQGWGQEADIRRDLLQRDQQLARHREHAALLLWFEHDLYDQLQLLQILDRLATREPATAPLELICIDRFPGVEPFHGLGMLTPGQLASLQQHKTTVTPRHLAAARAGWRAFRAAAPTAIEHFRATADGSLPFLDGALLRHLQEFPAAGSGLSRTEQQILQAVAKGHTGPGQLFRACQQMEEAPFMGDWSFWQRVRHLAGGPHPVLQTASGSPFRCPPETDAGPEFSRQHLQLTADGETVLAGRADQAQLNPPQHWLGGVNLGGPGALWRWDEQRQQLVAEAR